MDKKTYIIRFCAVVAIIVVAIVVACWFLFGKVVEGNLFEEIAKWVVMTIALLVVVIEPLVAFVIAPLFYHRKYDIKK